jgi:hypothetical protein
MTCEHSSRRRGDAYLTQRYNVEDMLLCQAEDTMNEVVIINNSSVLLVICNCAMFQ